MESDLWQLIAQTAHRFAQPLLYGRSRTLGPAADASLSPAQTDGSRQLPCEEVHLALGFLCAPSIGELLGFLEVLPQFEQALSVTLDGL